MVNPTRVRGKLVAKPLVGISVGDIWNPLIGEEVIIELPSPPAPKDLKVGQKVLSLREVVDRNGDGKLELMVPIHLGYLESVVAIVNER